MTMPNFLHAGGSKCASSWLWRVCLEHPDIYVPTVPDNVNFFTVHYHRGLPWYEETYFAEVGEETAIGEFSNSYMVFEPALRRIAEHLPEARLTMTLRNPIERCYLQWAHVNLKGRYGLDPSKGVGVPFEKSLHHHGHSWFRLWHEPGLYGVLLERVFRHIPREQVFVMLYDDLCADPAAFLAAFFGFLGVDPDFAPVLLDQEVNPDRPAAKEPGALPEEMRQELREVYRDDIQALEQLLDRDLSHWR